MPDTTRSLVTKEQFYTADLVSVGNQQTKKSTVHDLCLLSCKEIRNKNINYCYLLEKLSPVSYLSCHICVKVLTSVSRLFFFTAHTQNIFSDFRQVYSNPLLTWIMIITCRTLGNSMVNICILKMENRIIYLNITKINCDKVLFQRLFKLLFF